MATINGQLYPNAYITQTEKLEVPNSRSPSRERSRSPSIKEQIKDFFKKSDNEFSDDEEERPKKAIESSGHSGHSSHPGHSGHIVHGTHFKHVGENVRKSLSSLKNKLQDAITSIKEKAAGKEETPQEVSSYLQRGAESGLFKAIKRTVNNFLDRLATPRIIEQSGNKNGTTGKSVESSQNNNGTYNSSHKVLL
uniref:Uncharacterized protein n=1 Tax=Panagrolaimus sp. PS1159 TaxID=55785 RepID=A0AC35F0F2_9BILA